MDDSEVLSTEDLRNRMFDVLKRRGLVDVLKAQLRNRLVSELKDVGMGRVLSSHEKDEMLDERGGGQRLLRRAADSLVADHLRRSNHGYTLSIFLPESGNSQESLLSTADVLHLLSISPQSKLFKNLASVCEDDQQGILWRLISEVASAHGRPTVDDGIQTDSSKYGSISSLEEQFAKVDAHYSTAQDTQLLRLGAVEERILCYQRQLEERSRTELNMLMARFRETELAQVRISEREQARKEIDKARRELERTYHSKFDALRDRERHAVDQLQRQQEIAEKETFTQRQTLLEEIEALKQRDIQQRRQREIETREQALLEEKVKAREDLAKHREETARRQEVELEHRIRDAVEKFKLEERTRYVDRLTNVEFREARVKENERRLEEQLQDVSDVRVEVKEKRNRLNELEAELIRTRHELLATQKQAELLSEKTREMADYQILKENNAVMRRELDNTKIRLSELMRDNMVERQKQEELLREMGQQYAKPTPEVALLRQQMDQLHSRHRSEVAIVDQERLMLQQRLQDEIARNKELVMKCEEQTWQQKQIGLEACDLRERLLDTNHALGFTRYRGRTDLDGTGSVCSDILPTNNETEHSPHRVSSGPVQPDAALCHSDSFSYSSDLVLETKNRLRRLETEAEVLEKNYRDFQFRVTSIDAVLDPDSALRDRAKVTVRTERGPTTAGNVPSQPAAQRQDRTSDQSLKVHYTDSHPVTTRRGETDGRGPQRSEPPGIEPPLPRSVASQPSDVPSTYVDSERYSLWTTRNKSSAYSDTAGANPTDRSASPVKATQRLEALSPVAGSSLVPGRSRSPSSHGSIASFDRRSPPASQQQPAEPGAIERGRSSDSVASSPHRSVSDRNRDNSAAEALPLSSASSASAAGRAMVQLSAAGDAIAVGDDAKDVGRISLDDAWRTTTVMPSAAELEQERLRREEEEEFERQRVRREEERRRKEEEAWLREQQQLEQLQQKDSRSSSLTSERRVTGAAESDHSDAAASSGQKVEDGASAAAAAAGEPKIDPTLEKYMALVQQQRKEKEQQQAHEHEEQKAKKQDTSSMQSGEESISVPEDDSLASATDDKDDFW